MSLKGSEVLPQSYRENATATVTVRGDIRIRQVLISEHLVPLE